MTAFRTLIPSLTTPDLPRCLAFYRDLLGFACTAEMGPPEAPEWAELSQGPVRLMLLAAERQVLEPIFFQATGVIFYFTVEELAGIHAALVKAGYEVSDVEVTFYGMRECYLKDPDGRQLTLAEPSQDGDVVTITEL